MTARELPSEIFLRSDPILGIRVGGIGPHPYILCCCSGRVQKTTRPQGARLPFPPLFLPLQTFYLPYSAVLVAPVWKLSYLRTCSGATSIPKKWGRIRMEGPQQNKRSEWGVGHPFPASFAATTAAGTHFHLPLEAHRDTWAHLPKCKSSFTWEATLLACTLVGE